MIIATVHRTAWPPNQPCLSADAGGANHAGAEFVLGDLEDDKDHNDHEHRAVRTEIAPKPLLEK